MTQPHSTALANVRSRKEWADIINADWRKSIDSIIQTGRDLTGAKTELPHGEFLKMVAEDLPFGRLAAERLMSVAGDPKIVNCSSRNSLPASYTVLSYLAPLSETDFKAGIESGIISPATSQRTAEAYRRALAVPKGETWGANRSQAALPPPSEARKVARETGRFVAASDGHIYSGATAEEEGEYAGRRRNIFGVREAIERIADNDQSAAAWLTDVEPHWLHDFRLSALDDAIEWLTSLKEAMGVVDA